MKVVFDQGTPVPLRKHFVHHEVQTVFEIGWSRLENGDLIRAAGNAGFDVLVTTDQNLKYQQNLQGRDIAIVVLLSTSWPRIQKVTDRIVGAVDASQPGSYIEVAI